MVALTSHLHRQIIFEHLLQTIRVLDIARDTIPLLRGTFVVIVDAVQVVVLVVPAEGSEKTSVIHPWHIDSVDSHLHVSEN